MARILLALLLFGQLPATQQGAPPEPEFPNGKSQRDELIKLDHKKNLADAAAMAKLAAEVSDDLEKEDRFVVSLKTLKKLDEVDRLAKTIRGRLKRF